ncbi:MAG TPA: efflux RND transporter periplasmic adaptor subunit [Pyrinomonadaceae bacterium]|nr:efflux RND transporter periplasmic adaptor subunit [Pyrinomonadaceae bacterium]
MKRKPFWKYLLFFVAVFGLFLAVVFGLGFVKFTQIQGFMQLAKSGAFEPPPTAVTTEVAKQSAWQPTLEAVGSIAAVNGVTVSTDLAGIVREIAFESGNKVHAGDLIVRLDTTQEEAQLHQAEAQRDWATVTLKRDKDLVEKHAISQSDYDNAEASYRQSQASVDQFKALIARKTLRAAFDGVAGIRQVNLGQYLKEGDPVVTLQSFNPIYANFMLPQQDLSKLVVGQPVTLRVDAYGDRSFNGVVTAINSLVDQATRNVQVQATLANADALLRPGMFAKVSVLMSDMKDVIAIPATAIHYAPYGDSIFVVSEMKDQTGKNFKAVKEQFVKVGQSRGDMISIVSGLKPGEEVVTSGVFRLKSGAHIVVNNEIKPESELAPTPSDS